MPEKWLFFNRGLVGRPSDLLSDLLGFTAGVTGFVFAVSSAVSEKHLPRFAKCSGTSLRKILQKR